MIAVDANGATRGPRPSRRALAAPAPARWSSAPRPSSARARGCRRPEAIPAASRSAPCASAPEASIAGGESGGRRPRRRPRLRRQHRSHTRRRHAEHQADQGRPRPALAVLVPIPGKPVLFLDCGANVEVRPEHLVQFAYMGAGFMEAVHGAEPERSASSPWARSKGKARRTSSRQAGGWRRATSTSWATSKASTCPRRRRRDRQRRLHNVALKVLEGTSRVVRDAIRERIRSGLCRASAAC